MSVYYEGAEPPEFKDHLLARSLALTFAGSLPGLIFVLLLGPLGLILYGIVLLYMFMLIFVQVYYLPESSKPSFFEKLRVYRCPYCRHLSSRMVDRRAVGEQMKKSVGPPQGFLGGQNMEGQSVAPEGVIASPMIVQDNRIETVEPEVEMTTFQESFKCSKCGRSWMRDVTHATKMTLKPRLKDEIDSKWKDADL